MKFRSPAFQSRYHKYAAIFWAISIIPTVLWWHDSVLWVALMSAYANLGTEWGAYQASKAEQAIKE